MPRPGTDIYIVDDAARGGAILDTGQAFMVGVTERGPVGTPTKLHTTRLYGDLYGERTGGSLLNDSVAAFFAEGGVTAYVSRIAASDAAGATGVFGGLDVDASSPGAWGNDVKVEAVAPGVVALARADALAAPDVPIVIHVSNDGTLVEVSGTIANAADAVAFGDRSAWINIDAGTGALPVAPTAVTLAGGADGVVAINKAVIAAALDVFGAALGPGQVLAPGLTSDFAHEALCEHVDATRRCALLDLPDSPDPAVLASSVAHLQGTAAGTGHAGVRFAAAFGPWAEYPSTAQGALIVIPYTGLQAGLIAKADAGGNPNEPAAAANGASAFAVGLSQDFTDDEREQLNAAGVCMAKMVYGAVETYGYRTAAGPDDPNWTWFSNSRVVMAIAHRAEAVAEDYVLRQIDGKRKVIAAFEGDLRGICLDYYNAGALYGTTPQEAFSVETGPQVNTAATIAAGELHAVIRLRCSPAAEWVVVEIVKVPVERAVAA